MGAVYEAVNESIERRVAIKILRTEYAHQPEVVARFFNEARAVNRISHPSIVQIQEHGHLPDGTAFIIMEFLEGETLAQRLRRLQGLLPLQQVLQVAWQISAALAAAHDKNIIHRDLKPSNLMLVPDPLGPGGERVKVLDFGIAKLVADTQQGKTASHVVMGTPTYMSPEQCRGAGSVDAKTDVYSLGVIIYELLAGQPPFVAEGAGELIGMHLFRPAPFLRDINAGVPMHLAEFVQLLLSKERSTRPSMAEAAKRLSQLAAPNDRYSNPTPDGRLDTFPMARSQRASSEETVRVDDVQTVPLPNWQGRLFVKLLLASAMVTLVAAGSTNAWRRWMKPNNTNLSGVARAPLATTSKPTPSKSEVAPGFLTDLHVSMAAAPHDPLLDVSPKTAEEVQAEPAKSKNIENKKLLSKSTALTKAMNPPAVQVSSGDELVRRAEIHLYAGRWTDALKLAQDPSIPKPLSPTTWRILGAASCHTGDTATAKAAYDALDTANRQWLLTACEQTLVSSQLSHATAPVKARTSLTPQAPIIDEKARTAYRIAQANYQRGTYGVALVAAEQAAEGGIVEAWQLIGLLACRIRDLPKLETAYAKSTPAGQKQISVLCSSLQFPVPAASRAK